MIGLTLGDANVWNQDDGRYARQPSAQGLVNKGCSQVPCRSRAHSPLFARDRFTRHSNDLHARPADRVEEIVDGYVVDVVRDDELVEIQTGSFASAARKLRRPVEDRRLALVHPVAFERWIVRVDSDGVVTGRRRSPKRGQRLDLFDELVAFPELVAHQNFRIELVMIREEELRGPIPAGVHYRYPRQWRRLDRKLLDVVEIVRIDTPGDLLGLLPAGVPDQFTSADIAAASGRPKRLATRTAYCLQRAGATQCTGRLGRLRLYERNQPREGR